MDTRDQYPAQTDKLHDHSIKSNAWLQGYSDARHDTWKQEWFEIEGDLGDDYLDGWHAGKQALLVGTTRNQDAD